MPYMLYVCSMSRSVQCANGFVCRCRKPLSCRSCFKALRVPLPAGSCRRLPTCLPPCGAASSWWAMCQSSVEAWRSFRCAHLTLQLMTCTVKSLKPQMLGVNKVHTRPACCLPSALATAFPSRPQNGCPCCLISCGCTPS